MSETGRYRSAVALWVIAERPFPLAGECLEAKAKLSQNEKSEQRATAVLNACGREQPGNQGFRRP